MKEKRNIKEMILELARENFGKYGYKKVKTTELAEALGISKRTLYQFFPSKSKLFDEIVDLELLHIKIKLDTIIKSIDSDEDFDLIGGLKRVWGITSTASRTFTDVFYQDLKKYKPEILHKIMQFREEQMLTNFHKISKFGKSKGIFRKELNEDLVYLMHLHIFQNILHPEVIASLSMSITEVIESIYDILLTGVLTDDAIVEYKSRKCCQI